MSVPSDTNVSLKIFEKLSKYKDLEIEVTKMWHLKTTKLPVVIGVLGIMAKTAPNYILQIPGYQIYTINFKLAFTAITYLRFLGRTWYGSYKQAK